ncbi:MAG: hypothetical protein M1818_007081 [Claussenomyces sp. TS43310]|nr:MAG: hypothetical protein M1818_007081 [Claussenomyces sp. TS43310]
MASANPSIRIQPIDHGPDSQVDFGATVHGIDLNHLSDEEFQIISDALHTHKVLVFKEQPESLTPQNQFGLTRRFDPDEKTGGFAHGVDPYLTSHNGVDFFGLPQVHILGRGPLPSDYQQLYGFPPDFQVQGIDHANFHLPPHIPPAERAAGASRFYQWHFDGALYGVPPPRVGCLVAVRVPRGPDVSVRWDDGSGTEMRMAPGATAMVSGNQALRCLSEEMRRIVYCSSVEYAPHCFQWMSPAHSTRLGHSIETEGLEMNLDQLNQSKPWTGDKVCIYPMVWKNPKTGEDSLQVHGQGALKLHLKASPDDPEPTVVTDLHEVRAFLRALMRPVLEPRYIYAHRHEPGEVLLWYNRALWHSITEFPTSYGPRVMHQCNLAASDHPVAA